MSENHTEHLKTSILIVDDTPNNLRFLSSMLLEQGYEVRKAVNGQMALRSVQTELPDLILLDVLMPDMSGYEVCHALKAQPETRDIPIIFLSALNDEKDKVMAFDVGAVDYVTKPIQFREVLARVKIHLTLQHQQKLLLEQKQRLEEEIRARAEIEFALQKANSKLQRLANIDSITHVANRRRFDEYLHKQWQRLTSSQETISLIVCEIDGFKSYVELNGNAAADECLKTIAWAISRPIKPAKNLVARYGDAKFSLVLPQTTATEAFKIAEHIHQEVSNLRLEYSANQTSFYMTISSGISSCIPSRTLEPQTLVDNADKSLHKAVEQGGDCTVVAQ